MSNFLFLTDEFRAIGKEAQEAEQLTLLSPKAASVLIRSAMEKAVRWMFDHDYDLEYPYDRNLSSLIHLPDFREVISERRFRELNLIRKTGNLGAHGNAVKKDDALMVLRYLHSFLGWVARSYAEGDEVTVPTFDESHLPTGNEAKESERQVRELEEQLRKLMEQADAERKAHEKLQAENATLRTEIKTERQTVTARRTERHKAAPFPTTTPGISEAQTRQYYIDVFLKEAGWSDLAGWPRKGVPCGGHANLHQSVRQWVCRLRPLGPRRQASGSGRGQKDDGRSTGRKAPSQVVRRLFGDHARPAPCHLLLQRI